MKNLFHVLVFAAVFLAGAVQSAPAADPAAVYSISATGETSIVVTDEKAATGRQSLRFTDGPTALRPGQPHLYIKPNFLKSGRGLFSCDLLLDESATVAIQFRTQSSARDYPVGPSIRLQGGKVTTAAKGDVFLYEPGHWITVRVVLHLDGSACYDVEVGAEGGPTLTFEDIPYQDAAFKECGVIVVLSPGTKESAFYLDNLVVKPLK